MTREHRISFPSIPDQPKIIQRNLLRPNILDNAYYCIVFFFISAVKRGGVS